MRGDENSKVPKGKTCENARKRERQVVIDFNFASGWESGAIFLDQSQYEVKQKHAISYHLRRMIENCSESDDLRLLRRHFWIKVKEGLLIV